MPENTKRVSALGSLPFEDIWESTSPPVGPCPDAETICALIEGTLPAAERAQVEEHLASCESCYQAYASAIHFLVEEQSVLSEQGKDATVTPFRPAEKTSSPTRGPHLLRWAAVLAVAATSSLWLLGQQSLPSQGALVAEFEGEKSLASKLWTPDGNRGGGSETESPEATQQAFQTGALAFDLELAVDHGAADRAAAYARELAALIRGERYANADSIAGRLENLAKELEAPDADLAKLAPQVRALAKDIEELRSDNTAFALGRLIEAGRIAASLADAEFLAKRKHRRALERWMEKEPRRAEIASEQLADLRKAWNTEPLDFTSLTDLFSQVEEAYGLHLADPEAHVDANP